MHSNDPILDKVTKNYLNVRTCQMCGKELYPTLLYHTSINSIIYPSICPQCSDQINILQRCSSVEPMVGVCIEVELIECKRQSIFKRLWKFLKRGRR